MNRIFRWKTYFFRGHNNWLIVPVMFLNFIGVQWLVIEPLGIIDYIPFAILFMSIYPLVAILIGRWDFKKGSYAVDITVQVQNNPQWKKMMNIIEENNKLSKQILEKGNEKN